MTFKLGGAISLSGFGKALSKFSELADALSQEIAPGESFEWIIEDLQGGSALASFSTRTERPEFGAEVRLGFNTALDAARNSRVIPFGPRVTRATRDIVSLVGDQSEYLEVATDYGEIAIQAPVLFASYQRSTVTSFGLVNGEVDQLIRSKSRFVIFAEPDRRPVSCYLLDRSDVDDFMHKIYGHHVRLSGHVERDRKSGRLVKVNNVDPRDVTIVSGVKPDFERALGAIKIPEDYPPPEERRALWDD